MFEEYKITLASASPRRRELLQGLGIDFTVELSKDEKEAYSKDIPQEDVPEFLARHKSLSFHRQLADNEILITADTLVFVKGEIIGKPVDREDAFRMIRMLSADTHTVITGVVLRTVRETVSFKDISKVTFRELSDSEIYHYIDSFRPYDKAGAYGIQEWIGYVGITSIEGSFYNIMGLPVHAVYEQLCRLTSH